MKKHSQPIQHPSSYMCLWCDTQFTIENNHLRCPGCGAEDRRDLIPIYMENNPLEQSMYTEADWHGG